MNHSRLTWGLAIANLIMICIWGSAFVGIRIGLRSFSPEHLSLLRLLIASVLMLVIARYKKIPFPSLKDLPMLFLLGFLGFSVYHTSLNLGEETVNAGTASLLVSTSPMFILFLSILLLRNKPSPSLLIGGMVAFFGVGILSIGTGEGLVFTRGVFWIIIASFSESLYFLFQDRFIKKYGFVSFIAYSVWGASIFMLVYLPGLFGEILDATTLAISSAVYLGIFPTVLAYLAFSYIISISGASEGALSLYLTPVATVAIAWIVLHEPPTPMMVLGGLLTFLGLFITRFGTLKKKVPIRKHPGKRKGM